MCWRAFPAIRNDSKQNFAHKIALMEKVSFVVKLEESLLEPMVSLYAEKCELFSINKYLFVLVASNFSQFTFLQMCVTVSARVCVCAVAFRCIVYSVTLKSLKFAGTNLISFVLPFVGIHRSHLFCIFKWKVKTNYKFHRIYIEWKLYHFFLFAVRNAFRYCLALLKLKLNCLHILKIRHLYWILYGYTIFEYLSACYLHLQ